jgi:hypothetical protein
MTRVRANAVLALLLAAPLVAQKPAGQRLVGTVTAVHAESGEIEFTPDGASPLIVRVLPSTLVERVAPLDRDLRSAARVAMQDIEAGDRALVTLDETGQLWRIVVMPAAEIARRNESDRRDWTARGVCGVVTSAGGRQITVSVRSLAGAAGVVVTVTPTTAFRRYAPDSVRFADAVASRPSEVEAGDQLCARGEKSANGLRVAAAEVVFGSFLTRAGAIASVDPSAREITITELGSGRLLHIHVTADSQLRRMPDVPSLGGGFPGPGNPSPADFPGGGSQGPAGRPTAPPGPPPGWPPGRPGGPPDFAQMIERMPPATLESLRPGETIAVSSTKGAKADRLTAIVLLANADMLVRMAPEEAVERPPYSGPAPVPELPAVIP